MGQWSNGVVERRSMLEWLARRSLGEGGKIDPLAEN